MSQAIENKDIKIGTLKKRRDFLRVAGSRVKWVSPAMILQLTPKAEDVMGDIKIGFTASKKVGNAVQRNKAKRIMREVVAKVLEIHGKKSFDYVLIARREILTRSFESLIRDLKWSLKRIHEGNPSKGSGPSL